MTSPEPATAYLDTCLVSGLAKEDLPATEQQALLELLRLHKRGLLKLVTSPVVKEEIDRIPETARSRHEVIYSLLADVPTSRAQWVVAGLPLLLVRHTVEDPLYSELKQLSPDEGDAQHIFQAIKSNVEYFATTDARTILKYRVQLEARYGLQAISPSQLLYALAAGH